MFRKRILIPFLAVMIVMVGGTEDSNEMEAVDSAEVSVDYESGETYEDWEEAQATFIEFRDSSISVDDKDSGVVVNENTVNIHTSGTYVLEGSASDSQIIVDAEDKGTVRIILNGVNLSSTTSAPLFVKQSENTIVSVEEGTTNTLTDASEYVYDGDDEPKATLYSKDDLTVNGTGTLTINGQFNDGITGNDDLNINGPTIAITAKDDGIVGRDSFTMTDALINIEAGGDGVKSSNDEDADQANIVLESGSLTIRSEGDGIASKNRVTVLDGEYDIIAGGGSPETIETKEGFGGGGDRMPNGEGFDGERTDFGEGPPTNEHGDFPSFDEGQAPPQGQTPFDQQGADHSGPTQQNQNEPQESEDTPSTKGIKAENTLTIAGGTISIDSADDALHSNKDLEVRGGDITVSTGDDALHGDQTLTIQGGNVQVEKSYEGIESKSITIADGTLHITSADDGVNVNGGTDQMMVSRQGKDNEEDDNAEGGQLLMEGGYLYVNAGGDGLDSNTRIEMTGGTVLVYGPTNSANGALDYNETFHIEGGTLIAAGSRGMAEGVSEESGQNAIMMTFPETLEADTMVYVTDSNGEVVTAVTPEKQYQTLVLSSPDLEQGETYTIYTGGEVTGEAGDGYYEKATAENGTEVVKFSLNSAMMYLNESGETEHTSGMFGPDRGR